MNNNVNTWLHGLVAAFVAGGASAVTGAFTASMLAPAEFNLNGKTGHMLELMAAMFVINGVLGTMAYLKQSPVPAETQTVTVESKTEVVTSVAAGSK